MKKSAAILFLFIILTNGAGFYVYYIVMLQRIHLERREALKYTPDEQLQVLKLSRTEYLSSRVGENEVRVNHKMYDIARKSTASDSVTIYCIHDEDEDGLLSLLERVIASPLKKTESIPQGVTQFLSLIFLVPESENRITSAGCDTPPTSRYFFSSITTITENDSPPPWNLVF